MRRGEEYVARQVTRKEVQGGRLRGRRRKRWMNCIKEDTRDEKGGVHRKTSNENGSTGWKEERETEEEVDGLRKGGHEGQKHH